MLAPVCPDQEEKFAMNTTTEKVTHAELRSESDVSIENSRRGYRLFAPLYDIVFGASLQHGRRLAVRALECQPGDRILEVCVGSGLSLSLYPKAASVTGIDLSGEMLAKAMRRIRDKRLGAHASLAQMNAEHLAFADASFDSAVVMYAMAGLPDPVRAMREIKRVCKPGAKIVIANHFLSRRMVARMCDAVLSPIYGLLRYRADLDMESFVARAGLDVSQVWPANLFGYSTVLVCRDRRYASDSVTT